MYVDTTIVIAVIVVLNGHRMDCSCHWHEFYLVHVCVCVFYVFRAAATMNSILLGQILLYSGSKTTKKKKQ